VVTVVAIRSTSYSLQGERNGLREPKSQVTVTGVIPRWRLGLVQQLCPSCASKCVSDIYHDNIKSRMHGCLESIVWEEIVSMSLINILFIRIYV